MPAALGVVTSAREEEEEIIGTNAGFVRLADLTPAFSVVAPRTKASKLTLSLFLYPRNPKGGTELK